MRVRPKSDDNQLLSGRQYLSDWTFWTFRSYLEVAAQWTQRWPMDSVAAAIRLRSHSCVRKNRQRPTVRRGPIIMMAIITIITIVEVQLCQQMMERWQLHLAGGCCCGCHLIKTLDSSVDDDESWFSAVCSIRLPSGQWNQPPRDISRQLNPVNYCLMRHEWTRVECATMRPQRPNFQNNSQSLFVMHGSPTYDSRRDPLRNSVIQMTRLYFVHYLKCTRFA